MRTPAATAAAVPTPVTQPQTIPAPRPVPTPTPAVAAPKVKMGGTFNEGVTGEPPHLDYHLTTGAVLRPVTVGVYSRLIRPRLTEETGPFDYVADADLAERWEQPNPTTWVFHLRRGAKFQNIPPVNGREVIADDVVWSFGRAVSQKGGALRGVFSMVSKVEKVDPYTVRFTLDSPSPVFLDRLMADQTVVIAPKEIADKDGDLKRTAVGSGPWILDRWDRGSRIALRKNPGFYLPGEPRLDRVNLITIPDPQTRLTAFLAGRLDVIEPSLKSQISDIQRSVPKAQVTSVPTGPSWLSVRSDIPPTNDARVRRALSMAINRQALIATVQQGEGEISLHILPTLPDALPKKDWGTDAKYLEYRPDDAKALLREAGYSASPVSLGLWHRPGQASVLDLQVESIIESFQQAGIKVDPIMRDPAAWTSAVYGGEYKHLAMSPQVSLPFWDQWIVDYQRTGGRRMNTFHGDKQLDALIDKASQELDKAKRTQILREVQLITLRQLYTIPIVTGARYWVRQPYVRGFVHHYDTITGAHRSKVWLDK
ncbi:MAG: ABC transporter substrate-binding protein [Chloroflexi bacterium]|nr:ABC transporter substrate-binding protein [Chloroflexota bacterium]